ncbi:efflux RND transporter permease subunit [Pseudolysobacter antarcticus]|uniref:Efflux RND transporter permease subunit n=1 Tax=Pseudolysobacter antarcticus TaxID=2511995 RepID=A0A411HL35_9GAMM|nr:efflux RND transporter permease subunit [Pseudolysobacter antarcticus]QBB71110.1 efflux RND transporter permease subunit [Pseudolysobacter antarcticus]
MKLIETSLKNPIAVGMVVLLVAVFGVLSLLQLPLQLFPEIDKPQISIQTNWRAASPEEVESELLEPQEQVLQGLPGVEELDGNAGAGGSNINLTFAIGTDMKNALVEVIGRLNRVRALPRDADRPVVQLGGGGNANESLSWFFVQLLPGTKGPVDQYRHFIENTVKPRIEAVPGVSQVLVNAGPTDEVRITVDMAKAASMGISVADISTRAASSSDVSGGQIEVGRQQYVLRFTGRYQPEQLGELVLAWRDGKPIKLSDVATVETRPPERQNFAYQNGNPAIGLDVHRASGANVLKTLNEVKRVVAELREGTLKAQGLGIEQSFDSSLFINRAVSLLSENLIVGALLALLCVWWFMRDWRATVLIASSIPICLLATFTALHLTGHSLNIISLAGLAFAVGMVVEGAIVVSGNILRLKETGMTPMEAAFKGTHQVVGALIASTITTIAVFLPVVFLRDVEGQIFSDLALTISIAVAISVIVAITVLPAASGWLKAKRLKSGYGDGWPWLTERIMSLTDTRPKQLGWIAGLLVLPLCLTFAFKPQLDYLPPVKRAAIDAYFNFPPGMAPDVVNREIVPGILERMKPYMDGKKQPQLKNWYVLLWPGGGTIGARVVDEKRIGDLERIIRDEIVVGFPDTRVFVEEGNLFGGFGGSARSVAIHLQGEDSAKLNQVAEAGRKLLEAKFPGANVQAFPNTDSAQLELHAVPDDRRIAEAGWDRAALGDIVRTLGDGSWLGEYFNGEQRVPVILRASSGQTPEEIAQTPLVTPNGRIVPLGDLVKLETVLGPTQIRRLDHRRTVTLTVDPPANLALEDALKTIDKDVVPALRKQLPDGTIRLAGSADRLDQTVATIGTNFLLALFVLFLLMAAMFKSLRHAIIVVLTVPLALIGGMLGLRVLGLFAFQPLDLLSMIGFIMMVGVVVNHAILLVDLTRTAQEEGHDLDDAIRMSLNQRLRAILASTLTGALGALPMAINPGPGSVIYRGLAAVNVGGVVVSLIFSLLLLPSLMRLVFVRKQRKALAPPRGERPRIVEAEAA